MKRPYFVLFVVGVLTAAAIRGAANADPSGGGGGGGGGGSEFVELSLRLALLPVGGGAMRAVWQHRSSARRLVSIWGACIIALLLTEDFAAGFAREGLGGRVFTTIVLAGILAALALRVPKHVTAAIE